MNILDSLKNYFYKNGSSEASSSARIPLLTATGEPKGSDTMANIASVLGALQFTGSESIQDLDDLQYGCAYSGSMLAVGHAPTVILDVNSPQASVLCIQADWLGRGFQLAISNKGIATRYHYDNSPNRWYEWRRVDEGAIPSFYKSYQDLGSLANALEVTMSRRTRLTDFDLATLKQAVADQNLEKYGLKVGDQKTINGRTYVIAGLNPMKGTSTPYRLTQNHVGLIVIPHTTQKWNESGNSYTGAGGRGAGYANSDLHYYLVNTLLPLVQGDLGSANLLAHSKLLGNAVNQSGYNRMGSASGCTSSWGWVADQYISALSEVQVYGATVWSSSGYDTGEACRQLDVFRHYNHTEIFGGEYPWLRDVVSASNAALAYDNGCAHSHTASDANYVAALILFK